MPSREMVSSWSRCTIKMLYVVNSSNQELICKLLSKTVSERDKAWEHVYKAFFPMIKNMVMKSGGSEDDAADIAQDGMVILNRNLRNGSYRSDSTLSTYFFGICKNLWLKEHNRKSQQTDAEQQALLDAKQNFDFLINVEIVTILMNELGEDCRKILIEYYYNDRSMAELMEIFNVNSIQAAKNKKWRCMNCLIKLFKEKGVTPTWS